MIFMGFAHQFAIYELTLNFILKEDDITITFFAT